MELMCVGGASTGDKCPRGVYQLDRFYQSFRRIAEAIRDLEILSNVLNEKQMQNLLWTWLRVRPAECTFMPCMLRCGGLPD